MAGWKLVTESGLPTIGMMIWIVALLLAFAVLGFWKFVANFNEEERRNRDSLAALVQFHGWTYEGPGNDTKWRLGGQTKDGVTWRLTYDGRPGSETTPKLRWHLDLPAKKLCLYVQPSKVMKVLRSSTGQVLSDLVGVLAKNAIGADFTAMTTFVAVADYTQLDEVLGACSSFPVKNLTGSFAESAPGREGLQAEWGRSGLNVSIPATEDTAQIERFVDWCEALAERVGPQVQEPMRVAS